VTGRASRYQLWYGRDEPPARRPILHAGPVTATLDGPDLRHVRVGGIELVQRVYVAVRDAPWNTIPARYADWLLDLGEDRFRVSFRASHRHEDIAFDWAGVIEGTPDGTIAYEMDGACVGTFEYSKIGFNVHHALAGSVGRPYRAQTEEGELRGRLPEEIDPQRIVGGTLSGMFASYSELAIEVVDGLEAVVSLKGDLLELQDHRNWTDANFKSYATPLALGFPFDSVDGQRIRQRLTVSYRGPTPAPARHDDQVVTFGGERAGRVPAIGHGTASHGEPLSEREAALLRQLHPAHLRVDVRFADEGHVAAFERAVTDARALDTALEVAVHLHAGLEDALASFADRLASLGGDAPSIARVLVFPSSDGFSALVSSTPPDLVALVRRHLERFTGDVPFAGGTDQNFSDINRDRPNDPALTGITFSISPTVHAADDGSIAENLAGQSEVVRMARTISGERSIHVSPVTIATRFGPYPAGPSAPGDLPPAVDIRQPSLLAAAWTVGSIAELARAGADSVTYFETTGWRGVIERDGGNPMPERFPSLPGQVFAVWHVLADVAEWVAEASGDLYVEEVSGTKPIEGVSTAVAAFVGFAERRHVLVGNLRPDAQRILLRGLGPRATIRVLDEASAAWALDDPQAFRASVGRPVDLRSEGLWLALGPHAVARIDEVA
jgi:D-apionolactonase